MTDIQLAHKVVSLKKVPAIVVLAVPDGQGARVSQATAVESKVVKEINAALAIVKATGRADEVTKLTVASYPGLIVAAGAGDGTTTSHQLRDAAACASRALAGFDDAAFAFPIPDDAALAAVAEGIGLGAYTYGAYKSKPKAALAKATIHYAADAKSSSARQALETAKAVVASQNWARDLVNMPALDLYPESFAKIVQERFAGTGVRVEVMDEEQLGKENCGGLIGVGRGSARKPRLVKLTYSPKKPSRHIALVGKGITFDSGGLCIKPANGMATMKCDMAGAAAVAAYLDAAQALKLPVQLTGYLCLAENMTGDDAQRPGDVITMHNGTTVEIDNTDAEGRLVMADGLCFASELKPDLIIDIATLTGAAVLALGNRTAAAVGNNDAVRTEVIQASERAGEHIWPMPLLDHLRPSIDSDVADLKHTGERSGGLITAAMFLKEFVGADSSGNQIDWVHLDIAAPAFNESAAYGCTPKGGTGFGVRSLVELAMD